jgi:hypothetical protein
MDLLLIYSNLIYIFWAILTWYLLCPIYVYLFKFDFIFYLFGILISIVPLLILCLSLRYAFYRQQKLLNPYLLWPIWTLIGKILYVESFEMWRCIILLLVFFVCFGRLFSHLYVLSFSFDLVRIPGMIFKQFGSRGHPYYISALQEWVKVYHCVVKMMVLVDYWS